MRGTWWWYSGGRKVIVVLPAMAKVGAMARVSKKLGTGKGIKERDEEAGPVRSCHVA